MVRAAGFDDIEFPSTLAYQEQDLEALAASGDIAPNFMAHQTRVLRQKYAAHVLDYRNTVTRALEETHEWVAIFEDDIVFTTPPSVASERIRQAMAQVPPDTDRYRFSVYIECCELFSKA
jgi:GR25 family glycosyltransferase involved in LPS biosynthesis